MIRRVFSTLPSFKELEFGPGLNILVADTTPESSLLQTRNRAGKSSFIELVHFLTGGNADPDSLFRKAALEPYFFGGLLDVGANGLAVRRSGARPSRIVVEATDVPEWPVRVARTLDGFELSNEDWKVVLGLTWFGLPLERPHPHSPTLRSLFSYFARRDAAGGFLSPAKTYTQQSLGDQQVALSYLLGLDWTIAADLQRIRDQEGSLRTLRAAAASGAIPGAPRPTAELRTLVAVADERANRATSAVASFRVLDEYEALQEEADELTGLMNSAADLSSADLRLTAKLQEALETEGPPPITRVAEVYEQAGVVLPGVTLRRLDEVTEFHESVVSNRRSYLEQELAGARTRMTERQRSMATWDRRRSEIMRILESHGALSQFARLQEETSTLHVAAATLREEFAAAERIEGVRADLEMERSQITRRLHQDLLEREDLLRHAIVTFAGISRGLYEEAGSLEIGESPNGPTFEVTIQGGQSHGVRNMQIFCMDLTIMRLATERGIGPGFLIHDSHLFDGVDERQVAQALRMGAELSSELGSQYIVTLNSDAVPSAAAVEFESDAYILPVRLTDATEDGGLFGIRF